MTTRNSKLEESPIQGQQAGRRLSGNQQRELTRQQSKHPAGVESLEEKMKDGEKRPLTKQSGRKR